MELTKAKKEAEVNILLHFLFQTTSLRTSKHSNMQQAELETAEINSIN